MALEESEDSSSAQDIDLSTIENVTEETRDVNSYREQKWVGTNSRQPSWRHAKWWIYLLSLTAASFSTRLYKIREPEVVTWDEAHFGKFINFYMNRSFFFDVHPPTGKMILALAGVLTGYDGNFSFATPGIPYANTRYVGMRKFCATLGALSVVLMFCYIYKITGSENAALMSSLFTLCDHSGLIISRFILLDSLLLFLTLLSLTFFSVAEESYDETSNKHSYSLLYLFFCGLSTGLLVGVKFCGVFTAAYLGVCSSAHLLRNFFDPNQDLLSLSKFVIYRALFLLGLPVLVYVSTFYVHLRLLSYTGFGAQFFSPRFQTSLEGNPFKKTEFAERLAYGSIISLKSVVNDGAYLHSHSHPYPIEHPPTQQQVTGYMLIDINSYWLVKHTNPLRHNMPNDSAHYVTDGDMVILEHIQTRRNLHSHNEKAPITTTAFQVSCYGENGVGDGQDVWRIVKLDKSTKNPYIYTLKTEFKLVHHHTNCELMESFESLPSWGFNQREIICTHVKKHPWSKWILSTNQHLQVKQKQGQELAQPTFFSNFLESHQRMLAVNNDLRSKPVELTSRPWHWPLNYKGMHFSIGPHRVYYLGNPVLYWAAVILLPLYLVVVGCNILAISNRIPLQPDTYDLIYKAAASSSFCLLGWLFHYLPYFLMFRVLYFHHYQVAFQYYSMVCGILLDFCVNFVSLKLSRSPRYQTLLSHFFNSVIIAIIIMSFKMFGFLAYGMTGPSSRDPNSTYTSYRWIESWDF